MALHPHRAMLRHQDRAHRIALAGIESGFRQPGLDRSGRRQAPSGVQAGTHAGDDVALGIARPVGNERGLSRLLDSQP